MQKEKKFQALLVEGLYDWWMEPIKYQEDSEPNFTANDLLLPPIGMSDAILPVVVMEMSQPAYLTSCTPGEQKIKVKTNHLKKNRDPVPLVKPPGEGNYGFLRFH